MQYQNFAINSQNVTGSLVLASYLLDLKCKKKTGYLSQEMGDDTKCFP